MICDNFKISETGEVLIDFNDLLGVQLKNDNMQGFDIRHLVGLSSSLHDKSSRLGQKGTFVHSAESSYHQPESTSFEHG